jgi:hypothetical protein
MVSEFRNGDLCGENNRSEELQRERDHESHPLPTYIPDAPGQVEEDGSYRPSFSVVAPRTIQS